MMEYSFPSNKSTEFSFKVGIAGTSALPQSVALTLEKSATILSYSASKVGDDWIAVIDNPGKIFGIGPVKLSINVVLNNRIFSPMKAEAIIFQDSEQKILPASPNINVEQTASTEVAPTSVPEEIEMVQSEIVAPVQKQISVQDIKSILGDIKTQISSVKESKKTNILKSIEPEQIQRKIERVITESVSKPVVKTKSSFSLKRTKVVTK